MNRTCNGTLYTKIGMLRCMGNGKFVKCKGDASTPPSHCPACERAFTGNTSTAEPRAVVIYRTEILLPNHAPDTWVPVSEQRFVKEESQ